ncbi:MAG: hypothetical protein HXX11_21205 [Desulfuromonadales bacterium]|nr:hypothetical protein [Desulfuromonadales bacterium]
MEWGGTLLHGFWAHLEWDANTGTRELRFLLDLSEALVPIPLHIGNWTVSEAFERVLDMATRQASIHHLRLLQDVKTNSSLAEQFQPLLSMVLYLCSDAPDVIDGRSSSVIPHYRRPQPKKTKRGFRLFPPDCFKIWEVGNVIGNALRISLLPRENRGPQKSKRTHIRHHHWHGYWSGPKDGERKFHYKWQPTIIVNASVCTDASYPPEEDQT